MERWIGKMAFVQAAAGGLCLAAALALMTVRLAARYVGETELPAAGEAAMYVFVWGIFLESGALVHEKRHFAFGALRNALKGRRAKRMVSLFDCLVKLAFSVLAVFYGACLASGMVKGGETYGLERGFLWLCLPFCAATSAVYLSVQLWEELKGGKQLRGELKGGKGRDREGDRENGAEGGENGGGENGAEGGKNGGGENGAEGGENGGGENGVEGGGNGSGKKGAKKSGEGAGDRKGVRKGAGNASGERSAEKTAGSRKRGGRGR